MANPTISDVHVNVPLSNLTLLYDQQEEAFVADRVFPILPVSQRSDVFWAYNKGDFQRNKMSKRGPGAESAGGGFRLDPTNTYLCDVWSLHQDIPDQVRANADSDIALDMSATRYLSDNARLNREIQWASTYFKTSVWTTELAGATAADSTHVLYWNDDASTPIKDVRAMKQAVQIAGLYRPNKLVLSRQVFDVLCDHPDFVDRVKYGQTAPQPARVTLAIMATLFELDEVLVMDGIQNTASEDPAWTLASPGTDGSYSFIGGKSAMLVYTPAAPGVMTPGCGYTFAWTGYLGAAANGTRIKSFYMPWLESTRVEIDNAFVQKIVSKDLGGFFYNVIQ